MVGEHDHISNAYIGAGTAITADNIGVAAKTSIPFTAYDLEWDSAHAVISNLTSLLNTNAGAVDNLLTSYANAQTKGNDLIIAGAVNYLDIANDTTAWVGSGATLTETGAAGGPAWSSAGIDYTFEGSTAQTKIGSAAWVTPVAVLAKTDIDTINIGGNISWLLVFGKTGTGGQSGDAKAVGGAADVIEYHNTTIAGISDGATVTAAGELTVKAALDENVIAIAPTSGKGAGVAGNGVVALAFIDSTTHASISNRASVSAPKVTLSATEAFDVFTFSGSAVAAQDAAVGISVAYSEITASAAAYVGANSGDILNRTATANVDDYAGGIVSGGYIHTGDLVIDAVSAGNGVSAAVAATYASDKPAGKLAGKLTAAVDKVKAFLGKSKAAQAAKSSAPADYNVAVSGSSAVMVTDRNSKAYVDGATLDRHGATGGVNTDIGAVSNAVLDTVSGSAAINLADPAGNSFAAAIAGAVAVGMSNGETSAYVANSAISNSSGLTVDALAGGQQTVIGLGVAINSSGDQAQSASMAGSVSLTEVNDQIGAGVRNSTVTGIGAGAGGVSVAAYQATDIATGAGSLYGGGKGGFGIAFTYAEIGDPDGANAVDAIVTGSTITNLAGLSITAASSGHIVTGGATVGLLNNNGLGLSIVVSEITPAISASLAGLAAAPETITVEGDIVVSTTDASNATYDATLAAAFAAARPGALAPGDDSSVDFGAGDLNLGNVNDGALIVAVAGMIQQGKNNVGAAVAYSTIAQTHSANIDAILLTSTSGNVLVSASDGSRIVAAAAGLGIATGQFAGQAAYVANTINNTVGASIGSAGATNTNTTVAANDIAIYAVDCSRILGISGSIAIATNQAALGAALMNNTVGHDITASADGAKLTALGSATVEANSASDVEAYAIGFAYGGNAGVAGSSTSNAMTTNVTARIGGGADVDAENNVGVIAKNSDDISVIAGALGVSKGTVGLGASLVVNNIGGGTEAVISGAATKVDAKGAGATGLSVDGGTLANAIDLGGFAAPTDTTPNLSEQQTVVKGLAVTASSHQAAVVDAVSAGAAQNGAVALVATANLMGGTTKAHIDDAEINTGLDALAVSARPDISVTASSHSYAGNFVAGIAAAGSNAGSGAAAANRMQRETLAYVSGATIENTGAVSVKAAATEATSNIVIGFAGAGSNGLAASGIVNLFDATTKAYVTGGSVTARDLAVTARNDSGFAGAAGALAGGGGNGLGASFVVSLSETDTEAYVGDTGITTTLDLTGNLDVTARTELDHEAYVVGGAGAGSNAIAGMVSVLSVANVTKATVRSADLNQPSTGPAAGTVTVTATESVDIGTTVGALAIGGSVGVGAAAGVIRLNSQVAAAVIASQLNAGNVSVLATSDRYANAIAVSAGVGGSVGIAGTVGLVLVGSTVGSAGVGDLDGTLRFHVRVRQ